MIIDDLDHEVDQQEEDGLQCEGQQVVADDFLIEGVFVSGILIEIVMEQVTGGGL